jgi:hypothetical protein
MSSERPKRSVEPDQPHFSCGKVDERRSSPGAKFVIKPTLPKHRGWERPHFGPTQVRTPRGLKLGQFYLWKDAPGATRAVLKVLETPFPSTFGNIQVKVHCFQSWGENTQVLVLANLGVTPHPDGSWDQENWLERCPATKAQKILDSFRQINKREEK